MEELIFFGVLILFSILDAVAKKKRRQQMEQDEDDGAEEVSGRWEGMSTYEPPETVEAGRDATLSPYAGPSVDEGHGGGDGGSEDLVPRDIWEEIGALARGERPPVQEPRSQEPWSSPSPSEPETPPSRVPSTSPIRRSQVGRREVGSRGGAGGHPIHRSHADYGTDPSERAPVVAAPSGGPSREVREVRRALIEGGRSAARRAVILHEVLGPPLAYREGDPDGPVGGPPARPDVE